MTFTLATTGRSTEAKKSKRANARRGTSATPPEETAQRLTHHTMKYDRFNPPLHSRYKGFSIWRKDYAGYWIATGNTRLRADTLAGLKRLIKLQ